MLRDISPQNKILPMTIFTPLLQGVIAKKKNDVAYSFYCVFYA